MATPLVSNGFECQSWAILAGLGWTYNSAAGAEPVPTTTAAFVHKMAGIGGVASLYFEDNLLTPSCYPAVALGASFWLKRSDPTTATGLAINLKRAANTDQVVVNIAHTTGIITIKNPSVVRATSASGIDWSVANWIEIELLAEQVATGYCKVFVNGVLMVEWIGDCSVAEEGWSEVEFASTNGLFYIDDFALWAAADWATNREHVMEIMEVSAGGGTFTPSAGTAWEAVELPLDETKYVKALGASGAVADVYDTTGPAAVGTVLAVALFAGVRSEAEYTVQPGLDKSAVGAPDYATAVTGPAVATATLQAFWGEDPWTAAPWDQAGIDDLQIAIQAGV